MEIPDPEGSGLMVPILGMETDRNSGDPTPLAGSMEDADGKGRGELGRLRKPQGDLECDLAPGKKTLESSGGVPPTHLLRNHRIGPFQCLH